MKVFIFSEILTKTKFKFWINLKKCWILERVVLFSLKVSVSFEFFRQILAYRKYFLIFRINGKVVFRKYFLRKNRVKEK